MLSGFHDGMQMATDCRNNSGSASCGAVTSQDLVLADGEAGSNHRTLFQDLRGVVGHAHWDASTMSVKMHLARDAKLQPFQPYVISFSLKNAPQPSLNELKITAFDGDGQCGVHSDDMLSSSPLTPSQSVAFTCRTSSTRQGSAMTRK